MKAKVKVEAPGVEVRPAELTVPGVMTLNTPLGTWPRMYALKVSGESLPLKRWVRVKE